MPRLDLDSIPTIDGTSYPKPFAEDMAGRSFRRLGRETGLADFGVSHVMLGPGAIASQRHWHEEEDEFLVVLEGEAVLVEDQGETLLRPGDCAAFPKGVANGHHLINRSDRNCTFVVVGGATNQSCHYPDVDLHWDGPTQRYTHKDGTPYAEPGPAS